ncbi:MAG TPA: L-histidine N(alpha)-methyltransferase [Xanthobacteraceae bacterium]|nr:L-histidine N(alpha)-methyltransferase [Xanthobacteraceae bacterium]
MVALKQSASKVVACDANGSPFAEDALKGLNATPKSIPPKYFYDDRGCALFESITEQPEYYLTRSEVGILHDNADDIAKLFKPASTLVEFGSGSSRKTRILLAAASHITSYIPVDICGAMLEQEAAGLRKEFPHLTVSPVTADFSAPFDLPGGTHLGRAGFFPGSTIGNFEPHEAAAFLRHVARVLGRGAVLVVGVDLVKDTQILNAAYNDAAGVTEAFNINLLVRMNRELAADFKLESFEHHAFYNRERQRVEMHLASSKRQKVRVAGDTIDFRAGETIHTENSYKYSVDSFIALARGTGWQPLANWTDPQRFFCVQALTYQAG